MKEDLHYFKEVILCILVTHMGSTANQGLESSGAALRGIHYAAPW